MNESMVTQVPTESRNMGRRAISPTMGAVILIVVIVIVGGAGYAGLNAVGGQGSKTISCVLPPRRPNAVRPRN